MKKIIWVAGCLFSLSLNAQLPSFVWAKLIGGIEGTSLAVDTDNNVYTAGRQSASGIHDFDPGPGTFFLDGANGTGYICKLTTAGDFVWAKQLPTGSTLENIKVDAAQNVYAIGHYSLTLDFDPGPAVFNLTSAGQNDVYILKLDAAGDFLWAKSLGGPTANVGLSIAVGADGSVYTTGYFDGTSDFDPGPGTANMTGGTLGDCFVSKLSASGDYVWARQVPGGFNQGHSLITDAAGDLVISGIFQGTKDFDPGAASFNLTSNGGGDVFILKLNSSGGFIWAKSVGGIGSDQDEAVTTDPSGNVYVTGRFTFAPDFDPGPGTFTLTTLGAEDAFVLKLNSSGDLVWAKQLGGLSSEQGRDIKADAAGNVYTTGLFVGTADFDPGPSTFLLTSPVPSTDIFISKLNANGDFVWAVNFGGSTADHGLTIALDAAGYIYSSGYFQETVDFDPGPGVFSFSVSTERAHILKLGPGITLPLTLLDFSGNSDAGGILLRWLTTAEVNTKSFEIEWGIDGQQFIKIGERQAAGNSGIHQYSFLHNANTDDDNYYRLKMLDNDGRFTYSKTIRMAALNRRAITISPNPVINTAALTVWANKNEPIQFFLHDINGELVLIKSAALVKGSNQLRLDLQAIPAGSYFISSGNNQFSAMKIIKQ